MKKIIISLIFLFLLSSCSLEEPTGFNSVKWQQVLDNAGNITAILDTLSGIGSMSYHEISVADSGNKTQIANYAWEIWDISAIVPSGTIIVSAVQASNIMHGSRAAGSTQERRFINYIWSMPTLVTENASGLFIETYAGNGYAFNIAGYWTTD